MRDNDKLRIGHLPEIGLGPDRDSRVYTAGYGCGLLGYNRTDYDPEGEIIDAFRNGNAYKLTIGPGDMAQYLEGMIQGLKDASKSLKVTRAIQRLFK